MSAGGENMDLEKIGIFRREEEGKAAAAPGCSICLEVVLIHGERSVARLQCGHEFHLDCIGSAFNAKGAMQCPNCRKVEKGRWLYANGHRSPAVDFDFDGWVTDDAFDLGYSEMPFGIQWCPFRGMPQIPSIIEEGEHQPNSFHELMGNASFGDHSSASSSSLMCPYLAMYGFGRGMHAGPSAAEAASDGFHRNSLGGQSSAEIINPHNFSAAEPHNHNWQQQPSLPFPVSVNADQSAAQLASRLSRNDTNSQQRVGSFVHPHPFLHGSVARNGTSVVTSLGPQVMGEVRGHARTHGNHMYQQSLSSSSVRSSPFPHMRRTRPRGLALVSSVATSSSAEVGGFYGFSVSGSVNANLPDGDNMGRHYDRLYGWGRDGFAPLPWIPVEGESQWWSPFNPNQSAPQQPTADSVTRNFFPQRPTTERASHRPENGYQQRMGPPRMPPPFM